MHQFYKAFVLAAYFTLATSQSTSRQSSLRSSSRNSAAAASSELPQGRTLGLIRPIVGSLTGRRPIRLGGLGGLGSGGLQSDPIYGGGYPGYGGGFGGYGGYPIFGGYPGLFGGYAPYAYRPQPYYPFYGGYNPYAGYQRPGYGSYGSGLNGLGTSSQTPSTSTSGLGTAVSSTGSTAAQAQIANQLGQALGASLRPLLTAGGGLGGAGGASGAGGLASLLGLLG